MVTLNIKNSNLLVFLCKDHWVVELNQLDDSPNVVLLSAWEESELQIDKIGGLVEKLIDQGCNYFVCAGKYAEALHDIIDDIILAMSLSGRCKNAEEIMTSWHDTDTDEEIAEYFLYSTNANNSVLAVFYKKGKVEDSSLKNAIVSLTGCKDMGHPSKY